MRFVTFAVAGLALSVLGAGIALLLQSKGVIPSKPGEIKPFQVSGDPPVTVSDGSLHAHSRNGWMTDADTDTTIQPKPASGQLVYTCLMQDSQGNATSASLWADDKIYDILPGATVTVVHDSGNASAAANAAAVTIAVPSSPGSPLTITTVEGTFAKSKPNSRNNRQHSRPGEVESITIQNLSGPVQIWRPVNSSNPHFTLEFCYK
jgi:hypothetical protein